MKCCHLSLKGGQGDVLTCSWNGDGLVLTHSYLYSPVIIHGFMAATGTLYTLEEKSSILPAEQWIFLHLNAI